MEKELRSIELTEENKLHLFCAAWHLTNLLEDCKKDTQGFIGANQDLICDTCPHFQECLDKNSLQSYDHFKFLTEITGVRFLLSANSEAIRNREIRKTVQKLLIEEKPHESH